MSTETILFFAIGVFALMAIGMVLTMIEFNRISDEPSQRKGAGTGNKQTSAEEGSELPGNTRLRAVQTEQRLNS